MAAPATAEMIRDVNVRYHDVAAAEYDAKWGIDFGERGAEQVVGKVQKAFGPAAGPFRSSLEIGAGTGYFSLHLLRAGIVEEATATDISPGMLERLEANAEGMGLEVETGGCDAEGLPLEVETEVCDAERLPFDDGCFDLVFGHAVLHHIPDLDAAFAEFARVLRPGGALFFAGEPSRRGDRLAAVPKQAAWRAAPLWRAALRAEPAAHRLGGHGPEGDHALEANVDVHAFAPSELSGFARRAGLRHPKVRGEELLANWFGWTSRTLEASADPETVPWRWKFFAYRGYLTLQEVDRRLLEPRLPASVFYNLILTAQR